jgi:hypothetical protein
MTTATDYGPSFAINGLTFNNYADDGDVPIPGQGWFASIDGWDAAPRRVVTLPNITEDGDAPVDMTLAPRQITLRGIVVVRTASSAPGSIDIAMQQARNTLLRAMLISPASLVTMTVSEAIPTQAAVHSSEDAPTWDRIACSDPDTTGIARFQIGLVAPGGVKLAQTAVVSALGNGISPPVPSASASGTGGTLTALSYSYRVSAINGSGETVASSAVVANLTALPTPSAPSVTAGFSGTLPIGTYAYRVTALNALGETLASAQGTVSFGGTIGNIYSMTVAWAPVAGATSYKVYGRTVASNLLIATVVGTSYVDTGAITPSGAVPGSNTTGTTTGSVVLTWAAVTGATGYKVYGRTAGAELLIATLGAVLTYTDTGSVTPSGALPAGGFATSVTNAGDYETEPTLTVVGVSTNPVGLRIGTRTLVIESALTGSETLVVDTSAKTVTINGISRLDVLGNTSQWPELAPGANSVVYTGGGTASLSHRAAYA